MGNCAKAKKVLADKPLYHPGMIYPLKFKYKLYFLNNIE